MLATSGPSWEELRRGGAARASSESWDQRAESVTMHLPVLATQTMRAALSGVGFSGWSRDVIPVAGVKPRCSVKLRSGLPSDQRASLPEDSPIVSRPGDRQRLQPVLPDCPQT